MSPRRAAALPLMSPSITRKRRCNSLLLKLSGRCMQGFRSGTSPGNGNGCRWTRACSECTCTSTKVFTSTPAFFIFQSKCLFRYWDIKNVRNELFIFAIRQQIYGFARATSSSCHLFRFISNWSSCRMKIFEGRSILSRGKQFLRVAIKWPVKLNALMKQICMFIRLRVIAKHKSRDIA